MDRQHGSNRYTAQFIQDREQGFGGYELIRSDKEGKHTRAATVIYWDAMGQFFVETFGDVPLHILEELIRETKAAVRTK